MKALLVIGYGNALRGDDALGLRIAELVAQRRPDVELLLVRGLTPELAETISRTDLTIFVDARTDRPSEGVLRESLAPSGDMPWLGHRSEPRALLALAQALYGKHPRAWLVTAPAQDLQHGEGLSAFAESWLPRAVSVVAELLPELESCPIGLTPIPSG